MVVMIGIFLDIETTGLDPRIHKPIDIAFKMIDFKTKSILFTYQSLIKISDLDWLNHDEKSIEINGYSQNEINFGKEIEIVSDEIKKIFLKHDILRSKAIYICQNPAFDRIFFAQLIPFKIQEMMALPYHWLDLASMYWALSLKDIEIFPENFSISKDKIAMAFNLLPEELPHHALNGVNHLIRCYEALMGITFLK